MNGKVERYAPVQSQSCIRCLAFKGGMASALAHCHVIECADYSGVCYFDADNKVHAEFIFDVTNLQLDRGPSRAQEGEMFTSILSESDLRQTRENMQSKSILDTKNHPKITVVVEESTTKVTIKGITVSYNIPVTWKEVEYNGKKCFRVIGNYRFKQTDFGMIPYSIMFGAIYVLDELEAKWNILIEPN